MTSRERITTIASHLKPSNNPSSMSVSTFDSIPLAPPDPIFHLTASYKADPDSNKINLGVGAYRTDDGKPWVLPVVKKAEHIIVHDASLDHEYLPIEGLKSFTDAAAKIILGKDNPVITEGRYCAAQSISGTGSVRLGADFMARFKKATVFISNPTWANHRSIFSDAGLEVQEYPYWNPKTRGLDIDGMLNTLKCAPVGSIIVLHACAHNPTGVDPTPEQWVQIFTIMKERQLFAFFDCAYQGFASGDLDRDAGSIRTWINMGGEGCVAQSFSKNFGLYNERAGVLTFFTSNTTTPPKILSQLAKLTRASISNPPAFGARIVSTVLNNPDMYQEWISNLKTMSARIKEMRQELFNTLTELKTPGDWHHITNQIGMFSFTGLNAKQVAVLKEKYHVYMTDNGRISMAGLGRSNVKRFAEAVDFVVRNVN